MPLDSTNIELERILAYQQDPIVLAQWGERTLLLETESNAAVYMRTAIRCIPFAPMAEAFEEIVNRGAKGKTARATRAANAKAKLMQLHRAVTANGATGLTWGGELFFNHVRDVFTATLAVEDRIRSLNIPCPLRWWLQPSEVAAEGETLERLKPWHNYYWFVSASWLAAPEEVWDIEGRPTWQVERNLLLAEDCWTEYIFQLWRAST